MRYIDVDELLNRLPNDLPYKASVKRVLTQAPTADVVPTAEEVERASLSFALQMDECKAIKERLVRELKTEVARKIFAEIDKLHIHVSSQHDAIRYAELKKKYTEEKKDED